LLASAGGAIAGVATGDAVADGLTGVAPTGREGRFGAGAEDWALANQGKETDKQSTANMTVSFKSKLVANRDLRVMLSPL